MVSVASPWAAVVIGVGSLAPLRNATKRSRGGGTEVSPTSSLQLPTVKTAAAVSVSPPITKRPRIVCLLRGESERHLRETLRAPVTAVGRPPRPAGTSLQGKVTCKTETSRPAGGELRGPRP